MIIKLLTLMLTVPISGCGDEDDAFCADLVGSLLRDGPLEAKDAPEMKKLLFSGMSMEQAALSLAEQCLSKEPITCTLAGNMSSFATSDKAKERTFEAYFFAHQRRL